MNKITFISTLVAAFSLSTIHAAVTFDFSFEDVDDMSGFGFDDNTVVDGQTLGSIRQNTVNAVGDYISSIITAPESVSLELQFNTSLNSGFLILDGLVTQALQTGMDANGEGIDGSGQINFGANYNSGLEDTEAGEFDLFTVVLHEVTHALGFFSLLEADGSSALNFVGFEDVDIFNTYDLALRDADGNAIVTESGGFVGDVNDLISTDLQIQTDSGLLQIFSPETFDEGSSISHLEGFGTDVLNPAIPPGFQIREYSANDIAVLDTIGISLVAVPEPTTIFLFAFASVTGLMLRQRRA